MIAYNSVMENIRRNVRDLNNDERRVYEDVLGHQLAENQQVIIQVITLPFDSPQPDDLSQAEEGACGDSAKPLPDWCDVYAGLTDAETEEIESVMCRRV